jgi:hypothetical protein
VAGVSGGVHVVPQQHPHQPTKPGEFNEVTVLDGVARCTCTGFQYRGNCSHAQQLAAQVAAGTLA